MRRETKCIPALGWFQNYYWLNYNPIENHKAEYSTIITPIKLLKYFISSIFTFRLSVLLIPYASDPHYAVCTITSC